MRKGLLFLIVSSCALALLLWGQVRAAESARELERLEREVRELEAGLRALELALENLPDVYLLAASEGSVRSLFCMPPEAYEHLWEVLDAEGLKGTGKAFWLAERDYGVNGLFLAAVAYLESAGGKSRLAVERNNIFGLNALDDDPGRAFAFASREECIDYAAALFKRDYLSCGGRYYRGETPKDIGKSYASDPLWSEKVCAVMQHMLRILSLDGR